MKFSMFRNSKYYCIVHGFPWKRWLCVKGKNHKSVFFWLHSHSLSRNFTPHLIPTSSYIFSPLPHFYSPLQIGKVTLENQEDILQVLWDLGLMVITCFPSPFCLYRACHCKWPIGAWCLPVLPKVWLGELPIHRSSVVSKKVLSSNATEARGVISQGAAKAVGTEVADILQSSSFRFHLFFLLKIPCYKVQTWVHLGPGLDDMCGRHCWAHNLANCLHWPNFPWIKFCATLLTLDDLF